MRQRNTRTEKNTFIEIRVLYWKEEKTRKIQHHRGIFGVCVRGAVWGARDRSLDDDVRSIDFRC